MQSLRTMNAVTVVLGTLLCSLSVLAGIEPQSAFEKACRDAIDRAVASNSWRWRCGERFSKDDDAFQGELQKTLATHFPKEYGEALSCAGNMHNPKMRGLNRILSAAILQTETWRRVAEYSARKGYEESRAPQGFEKLTFVADKDGKRTLDALWSASGRKRDVTLALRAAVQEFRGRSRTSDLPAVEMAEYSFDDAFKTNAPMFRMRGYNENGTGPFRFYCTYEEWPEAQCAWRTEVQGLGRVRTYAEFDREQSWYLLARSPRDYTHEDVLKALGRPKESVRLRCQNCGGTDRRWKYEVSDVDSFGRKILHVLTFAFSTDGRCSRWLWFTASKECQ